MKIHSAGAHDMSQETGKLFEKLVGIVAQLRAPDGCPWDREQTPRSAAPYLIEEAHEAAEAIDGDDPKVVCEELGDLLLQAVFQAQLVADTTAAFTINDVVNTVTEKLIRRHPHVFGDTKVAGTHEVLQNWEKIKKGEKKTGASMLDGIPNSLPALLKAYRLSQKAARVGFDWPDAEGMLGKVEEEARELHEARKTKNAAQIEHEFGDLLLTLANLGRFLGLDPEGALRRSTQRFVRRFMWMEKETAARGLDLHSLSPAGWDKLWKEAKTCTKEC